MSSSVNLRALDTLRGCLAVYVLLGHARWLLWAGHRAWLEGNPLLWQLPIGYASAFLRFGHEAVMVFFVLSGFFIHLRYAKSLTAARKFEVAAADFYQRRIHRLAAPYCFALLLTVVCDVAGRSLFPSLYFAQTGDTLLDANFGRMGYSMAAIAPAMILLPSSNGIAFGTNGPLWSLGYEVVFYTLYPLWLVVRRVSWWSSYLIIPIACTFQTSLFPDGFVSTVLWHYPVWIVGALLAEQCIGVDKLRVKQIFFLALVVAGGMLQLFTNALQSTPAIAMMYGAGIVGLFASTQSKWSDKKLGKIFEFFGIRSYSIYITHFPILALMCAAVFHLQGHRPDHGWYALGGSVIAIAVGCGAFYFVEKRFLHRRGHFVAIAIPRARAVTGR